MLCVVTGAMIRGNPSGDFIGGTGLGVLAMLLVLHMASRRPTWSGTVPGLLGGMVAAAMANGWQHVSSWGGLVGGGIAIPVSVLIDRDVPVQKGSEATD